MLLKKLVVYSTKPRTELIREVIFNRTGLNLIVDETSNVPQNTGNSVGKSTAVKIIDLCLGAKSPSALFRDGDTRAENTAIRNFLTTNQVEAELIVEIPSGELKICRGLYSSGKRKIDGELYTEDAFAKELKVRLFHSSEHLPTLRQLIPRFLRLESQQLENMIRFIPMASNDDLEVIHLFLLNIDARKLLNDKIIASDAVKQAKREHDLLLKVENGPTLPFLREKERMLSTEIETLSKRRSNVDYVSQLGTELEVQRNLNQDISQIETELATLTYQKSLNERSLMQLSKDRVRVNAELIGDLYREAGILIPNLQKTFEEVMAFHRNMIVNKADFVRVRIAEIEKGISQQSELRSVLLAKKKNLSLELIDQRTVTELAEITQKIEQLSFQRGATWNAIEKLADAEKRIQLAELAFTKLETELKQIAESIEKRITLFNGFFSDYSRQLYNERYLFTYNPNWKEQKSPPFNCSNLEGNPGTGKKHAQIVAFDLAYIRLVSELGLSFPQFIVHDQLESTHFNQLKTIFDICSRIDGQFVVPILRERIDKLDSEILAKATILTLSQDDKFFGV